MGLWRTLSYWGTDSSQSNHQRRIVILTNRVSILIAGFTFLLFILSSLSFGFIYSSQLALVFTLIFLLPLFINKVGYPSSARILLSIMLSLASLVISVIDKFDYFQLEEFQYFEFRLTLLASTLFPFILFKLEEKKYWMMALSINFLCLILYDPVHQFFGVGYYQQGFNGPNYYFLNYLVIATFLVIAISTYFLKRGFEKSEQENELLISTLHNTNKNLAEQSNLLQVQQQKLLRANDVIQEQRGLLAQENFKLTKSLIEKNEQLTITNTELINHNNDLQQFSYTISHNLRGPVASITGLLSLMDLNQLGPDNIPLIKHFKNSVHSLETTIKDLSNIIDIRNKVTRLRQRLVLTEELDHVQSLLKSELDDNKVKIISDFSEVPVVFSVKLMVHSILYNLISNAIKYRNTEKTCIIHVSSKLDGDFTRIDISDNGLGIDMKRFGDKLFGLYKRFHAHIEGKGLGLFLVKLQSEALGGKIEVKSEPYQGTTFSVHLKVPENVEEQLLFENEVVKVYFDGFIDSLCTIWQTDHTNEQFEQVLGLSLEFLKIYRTPNWISDIRKVPQRDEDRLNKIREKYSREYLTIGIKRIAVVLSSTDYNETDLNQKKKQIEDAYPVTYGFFESFDDAYQWIKKEGGLTHVKETKSTDLPFQ